MRWAGAHWLVVATVAAACADAPVAEPEAPLPRSADWRDQIIYQIVVDRFANGDLDNDWIDDIGPVPGDLRRFQGGDWAGITARLDYLEQLGVTALWISPIVDNVQRTDYQDGYHGYWASTFTELNPRFGDLDQLRELVDAAHGRGMKVIIDVVANHAGRVFFYDFDGDGAMDPGEAEPPFSAQGAYQAPLGWITGQPELFRLDDEGRPQVVVLGPEAFHRRGQTTDGSALQKQLGDFPTGLRDLDTDDPQVVSDLVDTYAHWVELTGVDGFRLDAVPHAPHELWRQFAEGVRQRLADRGIERFLLLGEVFDADPERLASYTAEGGLDSVFDFALERELIEGFILDGNPAADSVGALGDYRRHYPTNGHWRGLEISPWHARIGFADNHDVPRLRYWLDDPWAAELAMTIVFTVDAIPAVYYGTEQGLSGGWGNASREVMWETGFDRDHRTYGHIRRLAQIRRRSPALRRGQLAIRYASTISARERAPGAGLLAYERFTGDERVLVALSGHPTHRAGAVFETGFPPGTVLVDLLRGGDQRWVVDDGNRVSIDLPPREAVILQPE